MAAVVLEKERLILRPFYLSDATQVQKLAGHPIISQMTANIPYPYLDGMAEAWIQNHSTWHEKGQAVVFAVTLKNSGEVIGTVSLTQLSTSSGNLGYWIGLPYWGRGYCTEAASAVIEFGFSQLALQLIYARHLPENPASGRVMQKNGFTYQRDVMVDEHSLLHYELDRDQWQSKTH